MLSIKIFRYFEIVIRLMFTQTKKYYYCFFGINEGEIKRGKVRRAHMCVFVKVRHGTLLRSSRNTGYAPVLIEN